jgi:hypothetical protein
MLWLIEYREGDCVPSVAERPRGVEFFSVAATTHLDDLDQSVNDFRITRNTCEMMGAFVR